MRICRWVVTDDRRWAMELHGRSPGSMDLHLLGAISRDATDKGAWDWWTADQRRKGSEPTRERAMRALERAVAR